MSVQTSGFHGRINHEPVGDSLTATLRAATRRIRALLLLRNGSRALCISALLCLLVVALSKFRIGTSPAPAALIGVIGFALLIAVLGTWARPLSELDVAKLTERRADLKERLSSALEFRQAREAGTDDFYAEQLSDAARHARSVDIKTLFPLKLRWELPVGLLATLLLFLVYYLPTVPAFWTPQRRQDFEEVKAQGINIVKLAQDTKKAADQQKLEETKKAAEEARKLGDAMRKGKMEKKQALVEMQKLTQKMEETQKRMAASLPSKSMEQAGAELKKKLEQFQKERETEQAKKDALKGLKNLKPGDKKALDPKNPDAQNPDKKQADQKQSEAMKKMEEALKQMADAMKQQDGQQMQQALEKMAQQMQSGQMSKQDMQKMQQMLQQMAQAMQNTSMQPQSQQMQQMAQRMQQNMGKMDPKTLQQMAQMMRQMAQMSKNPGAGMGKAMMDMKALQQLAMDLKNGRMTLGMGKGFGKGSLFANGQGNGQGGKGPGRGFNGRGGPSKPMKDPGNTRARLTAMGTAASEKGIGKSGSAQEFARYLAQSNTPSKHLPNGKIAGARSQKGQELRVPFEGDPDAARSNAPYYSNVYQTSKRQAESTLNKENIPAAYKEQVRKYFDTIRP